jgi:hypothetical protein
MATYLYCIRSDASAPPAGLLGIDGAQVRSVDAASLGAWVSDVGDATLTATVERVRAHDTVCAAALDAGETPLPIRFGQSFSDDASAIDAIATRATSLGSRLARVAGCVELRIVISRGRDADAGPSDEGGMSVLATPDSASDTPLGPGTAFLQRLARGGRAELAREVGCEEVRDAIREAARSFIVDHQRCESARGLAYFPVLVRRNALTDFRAAVADVLESKAITLSVLGPFAPYSFAGDA